MPACLPLSSSARRRMRTHFKHWPIKTATPVGVILMTLASTISGAGSPAVSDGARIVGEWRGTSICTNHQLAPACKDESVRYIFSASPQDTNTFHLLAERLESDAYQVMYEIDLRYSEADGTWTYQFDSRTCPQCLWWYRMESSSLVGGITSKAGEALRKVVARRHSAQPSDRHE